MKLNGNPLAASAAAAILLLAPSLGPGTARGNPPSDPRPPREAPPGAVAKENVDEPEASEYRRMRERRLFLEALDRSLASGGKASVPLAGGPSVLGKSGTDRVLVLLVEFAGTDTFTWTQGTSTWDPLGKADTAEAVYDSSGNLKVGDCSKIITSTRTFNYSGPLHNRIPRPLSASDRSGDTIWTPDFSAAYYDGIAFGNGWVFDYTRQDGSKVHEDFTGKSVSRYFQDLSGGAYQLVGDVYGWLPLAHSTWWYGADPCPGARSSISSSPNSGGIPGAGTARTLVKDALEALKAAQPDFDYKKYDQNGDGVIDRLWIIHAGYGEEDSAPLLNATDYSEASIWSHSSSVSPAYEVAPGIKAGPYIMMPENAGIGVLAHEFAHNIGASDLYSYGQGETSAGFWTLMADDWTGYPIGFQPPALDPYHLDLWGWLDPEVIVDPAKAVTVTLGQASAFPGGAGVRRGARIRLADGTRPLPVTPPPPGTMQWWGGMDNLLNARMTLKTPLRIPAAGATLGFQLAWDIETGWDFLWVQASPDGGKTWTTLTNGATSCDHDSSWIGGNYGFPADLCSAGIGGFTGTGPGFPAWTTQSMDLGRLAGRDVLLRFWYMTDSATLGNGPFVDNVKVTQGGTTLLADDAETDSGLWSYADGWGRFGTTRPFSHNYFLQWRNVGASGGYDSALGDARWRYGPANTGLLLWYNDNRWKDNEIGNHLFEPPSFGPKGRMLVVDAHPEPYRDAAAVAAGFPNEGANLASRSLMRDAPFSLFPSVPFSYGETSYDGLPAVPGFSDALGWYPGGEYVSRGPSYTPPSLKWITRQWDSSAVVPSYPSYALEAPGYKANDEFRYDCSRNATAGTLGCYLLGAGKGLGYDGGGGNPSEVGGQFGWNFRILSQTSSQATVRVWNTKVDPARQLALSSGRVAVRVEWKSQYSGETGVATPIPQGDAFGFFWFSDPNNPEVFVKVLDFGADRPYLVFYAGLTDFEYTVTFTVLATGQSLSFVKQAGKSTGGADGSTLQHGFLAASAFPPQTLRAATILDGTRAPDATTTRTRTGGFPSPEAAANELLLSRGRVAVSVKWRSQYSGETGIATPIPKKDEFGYFWFADSGNPEVFVKVLDFGGQSPYLLFWAGLTDFEYRVTFRNLATGKEVSFTKVAGSLDGGADTTSLPQ